MSGWPCPPPNPASADLVIGQAERVAKQTKDKFAIAMTFYIRGDWREAKNAAMTLRAAQRSGGIRYLEQVIARGNASQVGGPLIAVAYSGNSRAAAIVVQYWGKSKIPGQRALLILGPPAAEGLSRQLSIDDEFVQKDVIKVLSRIGTEKQIPALEKLAATTRPNIRKQITEAIEKIEARIAAMEKQAKNATKKKKK